MFKLLAKQATIVECGVIEDQAAAERWIRNRVVAAGLEIQPAAARLLAERAGTDVKRCATTWSGCCCTRSGQKTITLDDARQIAGPASLQDDWAMTNAIEAGDGAVALRQLALMLDAGAPPEKILGQLGWLVRTKFPMMLPGGTPRGRRSGVPDRPRPENARPETRGCCSNGWSWSCARGRGRGIAGR